MTKLAQAFFAYIGVTAACVWLALIGPDNLLDHAYKAGFQAGHEAAAASAPDYTSQCMAFWFAGDPVLADKKLKAACAARKEKP